MCVRGRVRVWGIPIVERAFVRFGFHRVHGAPTDSEQNNGKRLGLHIHNFPDTNQKSEEL